MKTIGIIGGMGPMATVDLFRKIIENTPAGRDQDHLPMVIDNNPAVPDRTAFLLGAGQSPAPFLVSSARRLESAGASVLCMPCNTAHYFTKEIRDSVNIPLVSLIESALAVTRTTAPHARRIGLFATTGTHVGRVYHDVFEAAGYEMTDVGKDLQERIMQVIYDVKAGQIEPAAALFPDCVADMENLGAEALIAGCTEIPLVLGYSASKAPFIDPTLALARRMVAVALSDTPPA